MLRPSEQRRAPRGDTPGICAVRSGVCASSLRVSHSLSAKLCAIGRRRVCTVHRCACLRLASLALLTPRRAAVGAATAALQHTRTPRHVSCVQFDTEACLSVQPDVLCSALKHTCQAGPLARLRAVHRWRTSAELSGAAGGAAVRRRHVLVLCHFAQSATTNSRSALQS